MLTQRVVLALVPFLLAVQAGGAIAQGSQSRGAGALVQAGSGNLFPAISAPLGREWRTEGDVSLVAVEGRACLRLAAGSETARIEAPAATVPHALYRLVVQYRFTPDTVFDPASDDTGLFGWLTPRDDKTGALRVRCLGREPRWHERSLYLFTPASNERVTASLAFNAIRGAALVGTFELRRVEAHGTDGLGLIRGADRLYCEVPRQAEPDPPARPALFHRSDPDRLFWYSRPAEAEMGSPVQFAGTPGETLIAALGLYSPEAIGDVALSVSDLVGASGLIPGARVEVLAVEYRPRRTDHYGRGNTWHWVADTLRPLRGSISIGPGQTAGYWLRLRVPAGTAAGRYEGAVTASGRELGSLSLPIALTVYPFRLEEPVGRTWGLYTDPGRWSDMTDDQVLRELADIRDHGFTVAMLPTNGRALWLDGRVVGFEWGSDVVRAVRLARQAGVVGPYLMRLDSIVPRLADDLRIPRATLERGPSAWPRELGIAFRDLLRFVNQDFASKCWGQPVFAGVDEPGYWKEGSPELFEWQYSLASQAPIATYCTSSYPPSDPLGRWLTYHCYGSMWLQDEGRARAYAAETRAAGQVPWYYSSGCYSGQVGNVVRNRYIAGFAFYRSEADGTVSWTFQRPRGDPFDDFSGETGQPCITYPATDRPGDSLDTPHWEGLRQAYTDFRYAFTLERALAGNSGETARREFRAILAEMPWSNDLFGPGEVTGERCDAWRSRLAELIAQVAGAGPRS